MSTGLALPSRPRAVRVIGSSDSPPSGDAATLTQDLQSFVRKQPVQALQILEDWLELESGLQATKDRDAQTSARQAESQGGHTHNDRENHDVRD
jgi:hypothetical protein